MDGSESTVSVTNEDELGLGLRPSSPSHSPPADVDKLDHDFQFLALEQHQTVVESLAFQDGVDHEKEDAASESNGEVKKPSDDEVEPCEHPEDESAATDDKSDRVLYPVRPDAVDCSFYLRTGTCKFGSNCKFNHPIRRKVQVSLLE